MFRQSSNTSNLTKIIIIVEFVLVAYLIYALTKNVYNSYKTDKIITAFKVENTRIEKENQQKTEDYLYFTSEEYLDKIAKQNLGKINHGEEVLILSKELLTDGTEESDMDNLEVAKSESKSNPQLWMEFFFGN